MPPSASFSCSSSSSLSRLNEVQEGQDRHLRCKLDWDRLPLETDTGVKVVLRVRPLISKEQEEAAARSLFVQHVFVVGSPMVAHCLDGFNCSMFAFGQTGSGKTYTMWGSIPKSGSLSDEAGIAPRFFKALFLRIEQPAGSAISMQIYNEQIRDLVEPATKDLQISGSGPPGALAE
ncbi:hypothetical protein SELMODRAFT_404718 [Selaginella moellendorffii]|uniref:Kinesin motor domain-containing protein n=1 Tax=Selaginella moellendorffii TaxID=88036 RepID=D8QW67_SELML|nr:hypothetical protein SELMODRAFT_404718 [Selaginella moellendorffii]